MFLPEYTITPVILKNISFVEYAKAVIENTVILPSWEKNLGKEAKAKTIVACMRLLGTNIKYETVKQSMERPEASVPGKVTNFVKTLDLVDQIAKNKEIEELDLKNIHVSLTDGIFPKIKQGVYRQTKMPGRTAPEEILARVVELFDWYNSLDAKDTHPVIRSAIMMAAIEIIYPFESYNNICSHFIARACMGADGYSFNWYISLEDYHQKTEKNFEKSLSSLDFSDPDFTSWIGYFTEGYANEAVNVKEKVKLLARDTKLAKATGRAQISGRQEKIVEYLQDYGMLQNKDFTAVFPDVSEDTVLRDLKVLLDKRIVVKRGSTKASRYELA